MNALRIRGSLQLPRAIRIPVRGFASPLPGYPTPGTAFSPPPAPTASSESSSAGNAGVKRTGEGGATRPNIPPSEFSATMTQPPHTTTLPKCNIPVLATLADLRAWRDTAFREGKSVGFIPTMGALHQGHITLVRESLKENDLTIISIYVNPAQFAPHEDLATYPRTLESDMSLLSTCSATPSNSPSNTTPNTPSAIFLPTTAELYPSGLSHSEQLGTYVLPPPGLASQMEGKSRPTFFRGVATVVTKLLNSVLPTRVYFGQKDIQQALLMRGMVKDLCMGVGVRIIRTVREGVMEAGSSEAASSHEGLAMSSRNAYLSHPERQMAPTLRRALGAVEAAWYAGAGRVDALASGKAIVEEAVDRGKGEVNMKLDYIEMNDPKTFEVISDALRAGVSGSTEGSKGPTIILSGALWVGRTRLIDNILLGDAGWVFE